MKTQQKDVPSPKQNVNTYSLKAAKNLIIVHSETPADQFLSKSPDS